MPTQERLRELFDYDPETGFLFSKIKRGKLRPGDPAGSIVGTGHVLCGLGQRHYELAHRIIWVFVHGHIPADLVVDHENGKPADNRWLNLRLITQAENLRNQKLRKDNKSGTPGVHFRKDTKRWTAFIKHQGRTIYLGCFASLKEAVAARKTAEAQYGYHPNHGRVVELEAA